MNDLRVFIIIFNFLLMAVLVGCVPVKRTTQTETVVKSEAMYADSLVQITQERIDLVMRSVSELRETMAEWLNENIDYEEQRYDSLGRLISNIRQTTNRAGGKSVSKTDSQSVYVGLTAEQVDSLLSVRFAALKTDMHTKERVVEKVGLSWWQKTLIGVGVASVTIWIIILLIFLSKKRG